MYSRLISFITKYKLLSPAQYGYQANMSTELAVNEIINNAIKTFETKETAYCIFLDFAKAFDKLDIKIALEKMKKLGIKDKV